MLRKLIPSSCFEYIDFDKDDSNQQQDSDVNAEGSKVSRLNEILDIQGEHAEIDSKSQICSICFDTIVDYKGYRGTLKIFKCYNHYFCKSCLVDYILEKMLNKKVDRETTWNFLFN